MHLNTWNITERAVYEGVLNGLGKISANAAQLAPEQVADVLHRSIMDELQLIINFNNQDLDLMAAAQQMIDEYEMSQNSANNPQGPTDAAIESHNEQR